MQPNWELNNSQGNCVTRRKVRLKKQLKSKENEAIKILSLNEFQFALCESRAVVVLSAH